MSNRNKIIFITLLVWLTTFGWLLRYEAFPAYFTRTLDGYKEMLSSDILMSDSWMLITFNKAPIGFSHTSIEVDENDLVFYYCVNNKMELKMPIMGGQHEVDVETTAYLDVMHQLQKFSFAMSSKASDTDRKKTNLITIKAIKRKRDQFSAAIISPHSTQRTLIEIPPDVVIHSPMTEMALKKLRPGQTMSIKTLEPSTFSTTIIQVKAIRKEQIIIGEITYDATLLHTEYQGVTVASWIDSDGALLKQETPFGWDMHRCTPEEALNAVLGEGTEDLLKGMSVPCIGRISNPKSSRHLKLKLSGVHFTKEELTTPRQTVNSISNNEAILTSMASGQEPQTRGQETQDLKDEYLTATTYIQSDDKAILARAGKITLALTNDHDKATAIFDWVYKNVRKEMTISLPSALDVLNTMTGDCNEHTYLFVALARAAGLPAKIKIGLAFHENAFYYHAWPAVYTDRWSETDPTWGQRYVDATHIAFVEGELADQLAIVKLLGQLKIEVLEESRQD